MRSTNIVITVMVLMTIIIATAWDLYVIHDTTNGITISRQLLIVSQRHPVIPLLIGVLLGHLFWPQG